MVIGYQVSAMRITMTVSVAGADNDEDHNEDTNDRLFDHDNACTGRMRQPEMKNQRVIADVPGYPRHSAAFGGKETFFQKISPLAKKAMINLEAEGIRIVGSAEWTYRYPWRCLTRAEASINTMFPATSFDRVQQ
jgi:hypothetical protein